MKPITKTTTEGLIQLDIRQIAKSVSIKTGNSGSITWSKGTRPIAKVQFHVIARNSITISYQKLFDGEWEPVTEILQLESTPCHLGGHRHWFLCPDCQKRIAILYFIDTKLKCQHCHHLSYQSQNETVADRQCRKARKIRERMKAPVSLFESVLFKPKGMHYKTFDRLCAAEMEANIFV